MDRPLKSRLHFSKIQEFTHIRSGTEDKGLEMDYTHTKYN